MSDKVDTKSVAALLKEWRPILGIGSEWTIRVQIYDDDQHWPYDDCVAFIQPSPGYFQASMSLNAGRIEKDSDSLEHTVVHELCHITLCTLSEIAREALGEKHDGTYREIMESTTERITRALLRAKYHNPPAKKKKRTVRK